MSNNHAVTAFAPATIGNVAVGFDMLGLAIENVGDRVTARRTAGDSVKISEIRNPEGQLHRDLSTDARENTASVAAQALWSATGENGGVDIVVHKGIALKSGMGSSAASAVAAVVAVNGLLENPLPKERLLPYALAGEQVASGSLHADNVAPCLFGGMILSPPVIAPKIIPIPMPDDLCSVLLHPELEVNTAESRQRLKKSYSMGEWLSQQGYLAGFLAALQLRDYELLRDCLHDVIIEPQRSAFVPCFDVVKAAALEAGALGSSLSGSGPSMFALCRREDADSVRASMEGAARDAGYECELWESSLSARGAFIESPA